MELVFHERRPCIVAKAPFGAVPPGYVPVVYVDRDQEVIDIRAYVNVLAEDVYRPKFKKDQVQEVI